MSRHCRHAPVASRYDLPRPKAGKAQDLPLIQHDDLFGHSKVRRIGQIQEVVPRGVLSGESQPENTSQP